MPVRGAAVISTRGRSLAATSMATLLSPVSPSTSVTTSTTE